MTEESCIFDMWISQNSCVPISETKPSLHPDGILEQEAESSLLSPHSLCEICWLWAPEDKWI